MTVIAVQACILAVVALALVAAVFEIRKLV